MPVAAATDIPLVPKCDTTSEAETPHFRLSIDPVKDQEKKSKYIKRKELLTFSPYWILKKNNQNLMDKATY